MNMDDNCKLFKLKRCKNNNNFFYICKNWDKKIGLSYVLASNFQTKVKLATNFSKKICNSNYKFNNIEMEKT